MVRVFIRTNNKQILGAHVARYAILSHAKNPNNISVSFMNVDEMEEFRAFLGSPFIRSGKIMQNSEEDLQSFTLAAFMAPELTGYQGRAIVIDPDVFALTDITELFERNLKGKALAARPKRGVWDTSVMVLDCSQLKHWKITNILSDLTAVRASYEDWMSLKNEKVNDLEPEWNSWDKLDSSTKLLHTTIRLTQPWKTGLKIDFTRSRDGDYYFKLFPKPWVLRLLGRWPTHYQPHPNKNIEQFFLNLVKDALTKNTITTKMIEKEIASKNVRPDLLKLLT